MTSGEPAREQPSARGCGVRRRPTSACLDERGDEHGDRPGQRHTITSETDRDRGVVDGDVVDGEADEPRRELAVAADEKPADAVDEADRFVGEQSPHGLFMGAWGELSCWPPLDSMGDLEV